MSNPDSRVAAYLSEQGIAHRLLPHTTPATSIEDAAQQRGIRPAQMVKSIGLRDMDGNYALACVPGDLQADPKKVRALRQSRRMTCLTQAELTDITGYQPGCVTPLLLATPMPVYFDTRLLSEPEITISSGHNMAGIALRCDDLIALCQPVIADIVRE